MDKKEMLYNLLMKNFLNNIEFEIINKTIFHQTLTIKILLKNHNNCDFSKVFFDIRFYDKNNNLIDIDKKWARNVNSNSESVHELRCFMLKSENVSSYSVSLVDVRKKEFY